MKSMHNNDEKHTRLSSSIQVKIRGGHKSFKIPSHYNCIVRDHAYNECPFLDWRKVNNPTNRTRTHGNSILSYKERRAIHSFFFKEVSHFVMLGKDLRT